MKASQNDIRTEKLYKDMGEKIRKQIASVVHDSHIAEDIFQESFMKIFRKIDSLNDKDKIQPWVRSIVRNTIIDTMRKQKREIPVVEFTEEQHGMARDSYSSVVEQVYQEKTAVNAIELLICTLPEKYREAVKLSELEKIPAREIASKLHISLSATKSRVKRGREKLIELMKDFCIIEMDRYGLILSCEATEKAKKYISKKTF